MVDHSPVTGVNEEGLFELRLSDAQMEILKQVFVAQELAQTIATPGWQRIKDVIDHRIHQVERQFLDYDKPLTQEAVWVMRERLKGIKQFMEGVYSGIDIAVNTLTDKEAIQAAMEVTAVDPADLDGELN